jgi:hypothetical protein
MTQAIPDLAGHDQHSPLSARAAPGSDHPPGGDGGPKVDEQEGRLAAIEAPGHLLPLGVRRRKDVDDGLQAMLRALKPTEADVPQSRESHSNHNHRDPWLEQRDQKN